jgi:ADP-ribose pyrophosphatase
MNTKNEQNEWTTMSKEVVHKNPWFKISKDTVKRKDGSVGEYYLLKRPADFVCIAAVDSNSELVLVKQFRYTTGQSLLEFPMGGLQPGEKDEIGAQREFLEETGYEAKHWEKIGEFFVGPGHTPQKGIVFLAREVFKSDQEAEGEEGENITAVKSFSLKSLEKMITNGKIKDGPTITSFYLTKRYMEKDQNK